ncbi:MAG: chitobiase/beta-hexosaminidase C-terminal domain-containing protein [Lachnospiraceae bacterium]
MKCRYCGQEIPDGILYCENCGQEVQMVPDYNPLDDMLTAHVKDSINGDVKLNNQRTGNGAGRYNSGRDASTRRNTGKNGATRRTSVYNNNSARMRDEKELRRRQAERRRELKKKKRRKVLLILFILLALIIGGMVALYMNSYAGIVSSGNKALASKEYEKAEQCFRRALTKNDKKADAYEGLSKVYIAKNDLASAENIFLNALEKQPKNTDIYKSCFEFYLDTDQAMGIPDILSDVDESVLEKLSDYVVDEPEFSLDDEEVYDDVQQLTLTSEEGKVLYTVNGTSPNMNSEEFKSPIQLSEGSNVIKAIAVNEKGVPSQTIEKEYVIEFPIEDAPAVSPSTGQYESMQYIEIKVPEGYTAYYTTDGNDPTTSSKKYTEPIEMPKGETLFKAILETKGGRLSGVTTRNYVRE